MLLLLKEDFSVAREEASFSLPNISPLHALAGDPMTNYFGEGIESARGNEGGHRSRCC